MKRSLRVLDGGAEEAPLALKYLRLGKQLLSLIDTGKGTESAAFEAALVAEGGVPLTPSTGTQSALRIVIRGEPKSPEARRRAELLEQEADLVLGSCRPVFARLFGSACATWVNS